MQKDRLDISRLLISRGALTDHISAYGKSAIHYLLEQPKSNVPRFDCFISLLNSTDFTDFGAYDLYGRTALHWAANKGSVKETSTLIRCGADVNACWMPMGWTPLHIAVRSGNSAVVAELLKHGSDVNMQSNAGWTALHFAANSGKETILAILLEYGGNPKWPSFPSVGPSVPRSLWGKSVTAEELVERYSPGFHAKYLELLADLAISSDGDEIFWDCE